MLVSNPRLHVVSPFTPDSDDDEWDVVVVGAGMGGSSIGYNLARRGHRVLFIERGHLLQSSEVSRGDGSFRGEAEAPADRLNEARWPIKIEGKTTFGDVDFFAPLGCGTGGSSNLYAAQLERLFPCDFEPRRHHARAGDSSLPERWPFSYEELVPYYRQAEQLFEVHGSEDPLNPDPEATLATPPPLSERDQYLYDSFKRLGLNPYRAHVGCRFKPGCSGCGSSLCPNDCKRDAGSACLVPALTRYGAKVLCEAEVTRLETTGDRVSRVFYQVGDRQGSVRGRVVVLAMGALMTPTLLLKSASSIWPNGLGNGSGQVGRNLMMHTSDFVAIRPPKKLSVAGPHKGISLNDLYLKDGVKMGNLQSAGMKVNVGLISYYLKSRAERERVWYLKVGKVGRRIAAEIGHALYQSANIFATVVEDLPYQDNRVELDAQSKNGMRFIYNYRDELRERNAKFQEMLRSSLRSELRVLPIKAGSNNLNFGHWAGTCRAGADPATSVVDRNNRFHQLENLYVADSSWFPSSGGINPSLTIAARALQVGDAIHATFNKGASPMSDKAQASSEVSQAP